MLTAQKRKFALALMSGATKVDAAKRAGYSEKSARNKGSQLAKDSGIIAFIERKKKEKIEVDEVPTRGKKLKLPPAPIPPDASIAQSLPVSPPSSYDDPMDYLKAVMNGVEEDDMGRRDAAKAMLPYMHAKKGEMGKKDAKKEAANKVASKFSPQPPPKLVVNNGVK
ncbi:terminase small subunit [Hafnia alvei]|uniref:terminase small subunit n=1 Tax=Hafnia alvei TaxID=569 RepID=UPI000B6BC4B4|nr:terminase small subunit [Hafnia alvei]MBI0275670.1 terminase small subunit [Hafnia alvei]PNK98344.1 terminase [Hafnia alvei]